MTSTSHGPPPSSSSSSSSSSSPSSKITDPPTADVALVPPDEIDYEALPTTSLRIQLLAGAIAGIAEHTIVYPIDAIKVPFLF